LCSPPSLIQGEIFNIAEDNYQVKDVAERVISVFREQLASPLKQTFVQHSTADRSYKVSTKKASKVLCFTPRKHFWQAIPSLVQSIQSDARYKKFSSPVFYNIQWMKPILSAME